MKTQSLIQGSKEWHEYRAKNFNASEASAMLSESTYMTRNELLKLRHTGEPKPVDEYLEVLFAKGHKAEDLARPIAEEILGEELYPVTGNIEVDGLMLSASFDGLTMDRSVCWEHKLLNRNLKEQLTRGVIPYQYKPQLEQQLLVSGAKKVIFMASDGTKESVIYFWYESDPQLRHILVAGWKHFAVDLKRYKPRIKQEKLIGEEAELFPLVEYKINGMNGLRIVSNIDEVLPAIRNRANHEMDRKLETDQDFADKEVFNKSVKKSRVEIKKVVALAQGEFPSYEEFSKTAAEIDNVLQRMQSSGEKIVKQAKENKRAEIIGDAKKTLSQYIDECDAMISPYKITAIMGGDLQPDWNSAIKGKKNIESVQSAVDDLIAKTKIQLSQLTDNVIINLSHYELQNEYSFLFNDICSHLNSKDDEFQFFVDTRIAGYIKAQEATKGENEIPQAVKFKEQTALVIPHSCMHELKSWAEIYKIKPDAVRFLESILTKYFKGH